MDRKAEPTEQEWHILKMIFTIRNDKKRLHKNHQWHSYGLKTVDFKTRLATLLPNNANSNVYFRINYHNFAVVNYMLLLLSDDGGRDKL